MPSPVFISAILPGVQDHAADQLDVEVAHAEGAARRLAGDREGLDQDVVEGGARRQLLLELRRLGAQLGVGQGLDAGLERVDGGDLGGRSRLTSRSCLLPKTLVRARLSMEDCFAVGELAAAAATRRV